MKLIQKLIVLSLLTSIAVPTSAFTIQRHENIAVEKNFVVGPAKLEATLVPGESKTIMISVDNKTGRSQAFTVSFEDFVASSEQNEAVTLLGEKESETSLKKFLSVEKTDFVLEHGDRAIIPVTITVPVGVRAGGLFGTVLVSAVAQRDAVTDDSRTYSGAVVVGRVGTLVFATVAGNTTSEGELVSVTTKNNSFWFLKGTVPLRVAYRNTGNVSLNPYGIITIKNMFGTVLKTTILDPWYALPQSVRTRDVEIAVSGMLGLYTATAEVNRGYGDIVDTKEVNFLVVSPSALVLLALVILCLAVLTLNIVKKKKVSAVVSKEL